jgi:hypothetical protein
MTTPKVLATGKNGQIIGCRCGKTHVLHVQFGNLTLSLSEDEFNEFAEMIKEGLHALDGSHPLVNYFRNRGGMQN